MSWILLGLLSVALAIAVLYSTRLKIASDRAPNVAITAAELPPSTTISVILPVYNEAENLEDCVLSVLKGTSLSAEALELWVVNDQSTDDTWTLAQSLCQRLNDPRLKLFQGQPRPTGEVWVGKNWACAQAAEQARGEFLLFIDADVRLKPNAIESAVQMMQQEAVDLLTCMPKVVCGCLTEWLVQPLIMSTILVGFNFAAVNDPATDTAFAAGPFMLFRRGAYDKVGGHRAVAHQVVEDVELSRLIKFGGLKLKFVIGHDLADLRMYQSGAALWEGWTKNFYLGTQRNLKGSLNYVALVLLMCTLPWGGLLIGLGQGFSQGLSLLSGATLVLALMVIALQYDLRRRLQAGLGIAPTYWWLTGLGGLMVAAVVIGSIVKTETGWGWTWRGRPLKSTS